jgi:hypothetical protein
MAMGRLLFNRLGVRALLAIQAACLLCAASASAGPSRSAEESVADESVRQRQHLTPDSHLLFNGLGLSPAGEPIAIGDMPMKILIAPDRKVAVTVCAGFNKVGVHVVPLNRFMSLAEARENSIYLNTPAEKHPLKRSSNFPWAKARFFLRDWL